MLKRRPHILTLIGVLLACAHVALATTAIVPKDEEMVVEARAIVTGRVVGVSTSVDASTDFVYTYVRLQVNTVLKGEVTEREIVLKELGGETREHGTMIFGMPRFEAGQDVLLYLNTWRDGSLRVHQGFLGKFNINRDSSTGRLFVERQLEGENVSIMAGSGSNGVNRSDLESYTRMVSGLMEANRAKMLKFEQRHYADVPLLAEPADYQSKESAREMTPLWSFLNPTTPARWFEPDSNQPVVFYANPAGAPLVLKMQEDMQAVMNAWSQAGSSLRVTYGGTSGGCGVQVADGANSISFNNCDRYFAASESCSGLLAVSGIVRYMPNQTKMIGGTRYARAIESNVAFNPYGLCNFTNRCQIQEVLTHEMGHALGLGHSSDTNATMAAYVHFDNRCASLMADDVQGISAIYPGTTNVSQLRITTADLPAASADRDYIATLEASGGSGGYSWRLVNGQMPSGIQLGMSGMLFGKTSSSGTYPITISVGDSSNNYSQSSFILVVKQPGAGPIITDAFFRKKKVFLSGSNFEDNAVVYVDGLALSATFDGTTLITQKKKQKPGMHEVYVVNPDGKQSATYLLFVE